MIGQVRDDLAAVLQGKGLSEENRKATVVGRWNRHASIDVCWFRESERSSDSRNYPTEKAQKNDVWVVLTSRIIGKHYDELRLLWRDKEIIDLCTICYLNGEGNPPSGLGSSELNYSGGPYRNLIEELQSSVLARRDDAYGLMTKCRWTAFDHHCELRMFTGGLLTALACAAVHRFGKKRLTRERLRMALGATGALGLSYTIWQGKRTDVNGPYVSYYRSRKVPYYFKSVENTTPADDDIDMWIQCLFTERKHR